MNCPLCSADRVAPFPVAGHQRRYHACAACRLVFVDPRDHPTREEEKNRYLLHRNSPGDAGYVNFLQQLIAPALPLIPPGAAILDYGCGPAPVLAQLLARHGFACDSYDPHFSPTLPRPAYMVIFASEVIEHFRQPAGDFVRLLALLAPGGWLCLMTGFHDESTDFSRWPYATDPTHVAFYHAHTIDWLAANKSLGLVRCPGRRVVMVQKPG